jgi:hypothetical protein
MNFDDYLKVYQRDNQESESVGLIQWKGTDACIDLHCKCGHHGHYDGYFLYNYECPQCKRKYALGRHVKLIELTEDEAKFVESHEDFKTDSD